MVSGNVACDGILGFGETHTECRILEDPGAVSSFGMLVDRLKTRFHPPAGFNFLHVLYCHLSSVDVWPLGPSSLWCWLEARF